MYEENGYGHFAYEDEYDYPRLLRNTQETKFSKKQVCTFDAAEYYYDIDEDSVPIKKPKKYRAKSPPAPIIHCVSALSQITSAISQNSIALTFANRITSLFWNRTWNSLLNFIYQVIPTPNK
jgi:hypothetical protein